MGKWQRFREKQGPALLAVVCVAVITGAAVWGKPAPAAIPPLPTADSAPAAQVLQERLRDVSTPSPVPTARVWHAPVEPMDVLQPYSETMVQSGVTGVWRVHEALDLRCALGDDIFAMADGTVLSAGQDELQGSWAVIDHGDGVITTYAGMADVTVKAGGRVRSGSVIGHGGAGPWDESDLGPHLHLVVRKDGKCVDPTDFLQ